MSNTFWDKTADKYDRSIQSHDAGYDRLIDWTTARLNEADMVLDFGCASGEMSLDIAKHVRRIHGIDLSGRMIALAKQKAQAAAVDNVTFDQSDLSALALVGEGYTAVVALNVLHLVDDLPAVMAQLNALLPSGGLLISQTPCLGEGQRLVRSLLKVTQTVGLTPRVLSLTVSTLEAEICRHDFEIVDSQRWDETEPVQWIVARKR